MGGMIGPIGVIILGIIYLILIIAAIYFILKEETNLARAVWIIIVLIFPIVGALIYIAKHFLNPKN